MSKYTINGLMKSAAAGDLDACHELGARYATGDGGLAKDEIAAVKWYTKAAELGHAMSQYDLGFMILLGEGTEKDVVAGIHWMEQAALNGNRQSAGLLKDIYRDGLSGIASDPAAASRWEIREEDLSNNR